METTATLSRPFLCLEQVSGESGGYEHLPEHRAVHPRLHVSSSHLFMAQTLNAKMKGKGGVARKSRQCPTRHGLWFLPQSPRSYRHLNSSYLRCSATMEICRFFFFRHTSGAKSFSPCQWAAFFCATGSSMVATSLQVNSCCY